MSKDAFKSISPFPLCPERPAYHTPASHVRGSVTRQLIDLNAAVNVLTPVKHITNGSKLIYMMDRCADMLSRTNGQRKAAPLPKRIYFVLIGIVRIHMVTVTFKT